MRRLLIVTLLGGLLALPAQATMITWVAPTIGDTVAAPDVPGMPAGTTMTVTDSTGFYFPTTISGAAMTSGPHNWANNSAAYRLSSPNGTDGMLTITFNQDIPASLFVTALHGLDGDTNGAPLVNIRADGIAATKVVGSDFTLITGYKDLPAGQVDFTPGVDGVDTTLETNAGINNSLLADISGGGHNLSTLAVITDGLASNDTHWVRFGFFGEAAAVPEPSSFLFLGLVFTGICGVRLKKRFWGGQVTEATEAE